MGWSAAQVGSQVFGSLRVIVLQLIYTYSPLMLPSYLSTTSWVPEEQWLDMVKLLWLGVLPWK